MIEADVIRLAAETAAKTAISEYKKEEEKAAKESRHKKIRNTKLLLRNYRTLKAHAENAVFDITNADEDVVDILELMWDKGNSEAVVESIKRSTARTCIIINHIDTMLNVFKNMCNDTEVSKRRWDILYLKYIADTTMTNREVADKFYINPRTVHKDIEYVCEKLSALIFGIDSIR